MAGRDISFQSLVFVVVHCYSSDLHYSPAPYYRNQHSKSHLDLLSIQPPLPTATIYCHDSYVQSVTEPQISSQNATLPKSDTPPRIADSLLLQKPCSNGMF